MPVDFGSTSNNTPPEQNSPTHGSKDVPVDGKLNFAEQQKAIPASKTTVIPNESTLTLPTNKVGNTATNTTGTLGFDRNDLPSDRVRNTELPENLGVGGAGSINTLASNIESLRQLSPLANVAPAFGLDPIINVKKTLQQILAEVKQRCSQRVLDELDGIDPSLRLEQLLDRAQQLCGLARFTELRDVIDRIQQAKRDIVDGIINKITDPVMKIAKLNDLLVDAINTGAQDLVQYLIEKVEIEQFNDLINAINQLDPQKAIAFLNQEVARLTDLGNFKKLQQLLSALDIVQSQFQQVESVVGGVFDDINALLDEPENLVTELQRKIREALNLNNYKDIRDMLSAYNGVRDNLSALISELDPQTILRKLTTLANEALANLDFARYNRIIDQLADKLCNQDFGLLPELPNVPAVGPNTLPEIVT